MQDIRAYTNTLSSSGSLGSQHHIWRNRAIGTVSAAARSHIATRRWVQLTSLSFAVGVVLLNIVVAVLLDEFLTTVMKERAENKRKEDEQKAKRSETMTNPLEVRRS